MDHTAFHFIDLNLTTVLVLFLAGFIGGIVGAFALRDGLREWRGERTRAEPRQLGPLVRRLATDGSRFADASAITARGNPYNKPALD